MVRVISPKKLILNNVVYGIKVKSSLSIYLNGFHMRLVEINEFYQELVSLRQIKWIEMVCGRVGGEELYRTI